MADLTAHQHIAHAEAGVRDARRGVRSARAAIWWARVDRAKARRGRFA